MRFQSDSYSWGTESVRLGQHLAFYATKPEELGYGLTTLYRWDIANGVLTDVSSKTDRSVGDESSSDVPAKSTAKPTWHGNQILMLLSSEGRVSLTAFDSAQITPLWDEKRVVYDFAIRNNQAALAVSDPTHPSGIVLARFGQSEDPAIWAPVPWGNGNLTGGNLSGSGSSTSAAQEEGSTFENLSDPVAPEELWATESDGTRVHTWCLRPQGPGPHPTILEIHGGPMAMYGYRYFHEFQCLVQAGGGRDHAIRCQPF